MVATMPLFRNYTFRDGRVDQDLDATFDDVPIHWC